MKVELVLKDFDFRLRSEAGSFPAVEINIFAVVTSRKADIDAVRMSAFKSKVRAFVESELPKHVVYVEAEGGAK